MVHVGQEDYQAMLKRQLLRAAFTISLGKKALGQPETSSGCDVSSSFEQYTSQICC
jgi:hypothetical protein